VAAGDYSQQVSYLGEFSEAFNTMTQQLEERERILREEAEQMKSRAQIIEGYNEFLIELTRKRNEWIVVVDAENREVIYCNEEDSKWTGYWDELVGWEDRGQDKTWLKEEKDFVCRITTFPVEWQGKRAFAHIIEDITDEEKKKRKLKDQAYHDAGTGIYNRRFFEEYMEQICREKQPVTLCYLDLDRLKYVNDYYGHAEGDSYIRRLVQNIQTRFRSTDLFARIGGDEFCLVLPGYCRNMAEEKLEQARLDFQDENQSGYPAGFSYGVIEIDEEKAGWELDRLVSEADCAMYEFKRSHRV
jgi:diguanylate cyclase (GGDEF)-like protein